ncbi:copper chaperone PCu(A)C [Maricaulis sp.]|uniref:copper chaperone PCu(A)C n=1 Tax=Maricaulis sp. TaxID=1486257 RepID=UPI0025C0F073|nr:copper chaperone PCu(A)C [Maricaulis sp.]
MKMHFLLPAIGLAVTACGGGSDPVEPEAAHQADGAMHAMDGAQPGALPDDGVMPVVDIGLAWMRPHPQGRDVTAAYFSASLSQGHADRLLSARIDGATRVEMHGHIMDDQGMMRMRPVPPQDLNDTGALIFRPAGLHLMVHGLAAVAEGDRVGGVLVFERSGEVPVVFQVRNTPPDAPADE